MPTSNSWVKTTGQWTETYVLRRMFCGCIPVPVWRPTEVSVTLSPLEASLGRAHHGAGALRGGTVKAAVGTRHRHKPLRWLLTGSLTFPKRNLFPKRNFTFLRATSTLHVSFACALDSRLRQGSLCKFACTYISCLQLSQQAGIFCAERQCLQKGRSLEQMQREQKTTSLSLAF